MTARVITQLRRRARADAWGERMLVARERPGWRALARCKGRTRLYYSDVNTGRGRSICEGCPVRMDCLAACRAFELDVDPRYWFGVNGGLSPAERRRVVDKETLRLSSSIHNIRTGLSTGNSQGYIPSDAQANGRTLQGESKRPAPLERPGHDQKASS